MSQRKAIFNGFQSGSLPAISITRDTAKDDIVAGGTIAVNTPCYGHPAARCKFGEWVETTSHAGSWNVCCAGYDSDGVTPMATAFRSANSIYCFWVNTDIDGAATDGGSTVLEISGIRATSQTINEESSGTSTVRDILFGASTGAGDVLHTESTVALRPRAAICLPGCFLFLCERLRNTTGIIWKTEGIALVAMQHDGNGNFTRKWLGDLQTDYLTDAFFSGWVRGREWAMASYFPFTLAQIPLTRAFIPFVDYINDALQSTQKKGGQLGIIEATRTDADTDWSFGAIFKIAFELETDGVHFHSAAWTPRGVVLSIGDGPSLNENVLFTCSDWDDYTTGGNWTTVRKAFGAGTFGSDPEKGHANQWAGAVPHPTDINKVLVGGDVTPASVYEMEVLADNTIAYLPRWGYMAGNDLQAHVNLGMAGPSPESRHLIMARSVAQVGSTLTLHCPIIASSDGISFAAAARMPSVGTPSNLWQIHGTDMYIFNLGGASSIYKMPLPSVKAHRGLAIGPGGTNLLDIDGTDYHADTPFSNTTISTVIDATAPNSNPVLDIEETGNSADGRLFRINVAGSTYAFSATCGYVVFWVKNLLNTGIPMRLIWNDNGAGGNGAYARQAYYPGIVSDGWHLAVYTIENPTTPYANPHNATLTFEHESGIVGYCHFRMQMQGVYEGPQLPYFIATQATGANEEAEQTLTGLSDTWTVGIELHVPMGGEDYNYVAHPTNIMDTVALATVYVDANNYVLITADLTDDSIDFDTVVSGSSIGVTRLTNFSLQRDNTVQLGVTFDGTTLTFFAACGGLDENGLSTGTDVGDIGTPATVRIGDEDFAQVPNTELNMVAIDTEIALLASDFLELMADAFEPGLGGGYAAMSYANLVIPKIM